MMEPKVCVLMSTYNGEQYLEEQIESILNQQECSVSLMVRDDGSSDRTLSILEKYQERGKLTYYQGSNVRPARSFLELVDQAPESDYYAFSDQDDIWLPKKMISAVRKLESECTDTHEPMVYFSNLTAVDQHGNIIKEKILDTGHINTEFQAVLLRCGYIFGCTQVFNHALKERVKQAKHPARQPMHDIWLAMVCGMYGKIIYDDRTFIHYRQHGSNVVGAQLSFKAKLESRLKRLTKGRVIAANIIADSLLEIAQQWPIAQKDQILLETVSHYKDGFTAKLRYILTTGIQKQVFKRIMFETFLIMIEKY